jgi:hypothetical protein
MLAFFMSVLTRGAVPPFNGGCSREVPTCRESVFCPRGYRASSAPVADAPCDTLPEMATLGALRLGKLDVAETYWAATYATS